MSFANCWWSESRHRKQEANPLETCQIVGLLGYPCPSLISETSDDLTNIACKWSALALAIIGAASVLLILVDSEGINGILPCNVAKHFQKGKPASTPEAFCSACSSAIWPCASQCALRLARKKTLSAGSNVGGHHDGLFRFFVFFSPHISMACSAMRRRMGSGLIA